MTQYAKDEFPFNPEDFGIHPQKWATMTEIERVPTYNEYLRSLPFGINTRDRWNDPENET